MRIHSKSLTVEMSVGLNLPRITWQRDYYAAWVNQSQFLCSKIDELVPTGHWTCSLFANGHFGGCLSGLHNVSYLLFMLLYLLFMLLYMRTGVSSSTTCSIFSCSSFIHCNMTNGKRILDIPAVEDFWSIFIMNDEDYFLETENPIYKSHFFSKTT